VEVWDGRIAEMLEAMCGQATISGLLLGRDQFIAENENAACNGRGHDDASMGPRPDDRGNKPRPMPRLFS
jgi:hypothetical protein